MRFAPFLPFFFALAACAVNPVTGKRELMLITEAQEYEIGRNAVPEMEKEFGGVVQDQNLNNYVNEVGWKVAAVAKRLHRKDVVYEFKVLNSNVPNAFALPGGFCYITMGLLTRLQNEAQLAGVLGHEVGHVNHRHSASRISKQFAYTFILQAGLVIASSSKKVKTDTLVAGYILTQFLGRLLLMGFSREDESESDDVGADYMVKAGYNPWGLVQVMEILQQTEIEHGGSAVPTIFRTHPQSKDRAEALKRLISTRYKDANNLSFYEKEFEERTGFKGKLEAYKFAGKAADLLAAREYSAAHDNIELSIKLQPNNYYFRVVQGNIFEAQKEYNKAYSSYYTAYQLNSSAFEPRFFTGRVLHNMGKAKDAVHYLKLAEEISPANPDVHYLLAQAYAKLNDMRLSKKHGDIYDELQRANKS